MKSLLKLFLLIFLLFGSVYLAGKVFNIVRADFYHKKALVLFNKADFKKAYDYSVAAIKTNGMEPEYHVQKAKTIVGLLPSEEGGKKLIEEAFKDIEKAISLNENNLVTKRNVIPLFYFLCAGNPEAPGISDDFYQYCSERAKNYYLDLESKYPLDVGVLSQVAVYQKKSGFLEDYYNSREKINKLRPDLLDWYLVE